VNGVDTVGPGPYAVTHSVHDGLVDQEVYLRCPDCGALLWMPLRLESFADGSSGELHVDVLVEQDAFEAAMDSHAALNPELHPTWRSPSE
jgi:hypothetical protein